MARYELTDPKARKKTKDEEKGMALKEIECWYSSLNFQIRWKKIVSFACYCFMEISLQFQNKLRGLLISTIKSEKHCEIRGVTGTFIHGHRQGCVSRLDQDMSVSVPWAVMVMSMTGECNKCVAQLHSSGAYTLSGCISCISSKTLEKHNGHKTGGKSFMVHAVEYCSNRLLI